VYWTVSLEKFDHRAFYDYLLSQGIKIKPFDEDANLYRFATHFHIRKQEVEQITSAVRRYFESLPQ
jgi:threonine aldolase